jgi:hypothetical protein
MKTIIVLSAILVVIMGFSSCQEKRYIDQLVNKGSLYYLSQNSKKPFKGKAYSKVKRRDIEYILAYYTFKDGVPNGSWETYGYEHEILQKGKFTPTLDVEDLKRDFPYLKRVNINRYSEGDENLQIDIFLISSDPTKDSINYLQKKENLFRYLYDKAILDKNERQKISEYIVSDGEF